MMEFVDILLICGKKCNFRCNYCYTNNKVHPFKDENNILMENIDLVFCHIDWYVQRSKKVKLTFYGGEPLVYLNFVEAIIKRYKDVPNVVFCLVTNGSLLVDNFNLFADIPSSRIFFCISYDYAVQNHTRSNNTYSSVRDAIKFVIKNNYRLKTITTIDVNNVTFLKDIYLDYRKLCNETNSKIYGALNIFEDSWKNKNFDFNDQELINTLKYIRYNYDNQKPSFVINAKMLNRKILDSNLKFLRSTYAICPDGIITWDVRSWWFDNTIPYLTNGTIFDTPQVVYNNRNLVLNEYNGKVSQECIDCPADSCKIPAFQWHWKDKPIYWCTPPNENNKHFCQVTRFFSKYLPTKK